MIHWLRSKVKQEVFIENRLKEITSKSNIIYLTFYDSSVDNFRSTEEVTMTINSDAILNLNKYSSWSKIRYILINVIKFLQNSSRKIKTINFSFKDLPISPNFLASEIK